MAQQQPDFDEQLRAALRFRGHTPSQIEYMVEQNKKNEALRLAEAAKRNAEASLLAARKAECDRIARGLIAKSAGHPNNTVELVHGQFNFTEGSSDMVMARLSQVDPRFADVHLYAQNNLTYIKRINKVIAYGRSYWLRKKITAGATHIVLPYPQEYIERMSHLLIHGRVTMAQEDLSRFMGEIIVGMELP